MTVPTARSQRVARSRVSRNGTTALGTLACLTVLLLAGCASSSTSSGPYQPIAEGARDTALARTLTDEAIELMTENPTEAEQLLRDALTADLYHGPAHNNLGVLLLENGHPYDAAQEFQWAARLMPGHPDPRLNLALTFERAGRIDEALSYYDTALEVYPGHLPTTQALVRCQLRYDRPDERTNELLQSIALSGEDESWRDWAKLQLARREGR